jgi:hypothetical protein
MRIRNVLTHLLHPLEHIQIEARQDKKPRKNSGFFAFQVEWILPVINTALWRFLLVHHLLIRQRLIVLAL